MNTKKYNEMSTEELVKTEKSMKSITAMLGGALLVLIVINIFLAFKKGFSAISVVPIALIPIFIMNFGNLKAIKEELKSRDNI
ncbi:redox-active disulfide protein 2 [Pedobacter aquatilis]|uniref:redox-active disulfide protein 2 n=1 Tax=Pedobacter aquatilis TaxID=351343 RepID=UPI0025B37CE8|nr:redox-active disulfide protein 2 [Pedobacter aquatilis]MDN3587927.1 redox-active disulfide protein 2 [Pedobacter aquatilis]